MSVARWAALLGGALWIAFALWASLETVGRLADDASWLAFAQHGIGHVWTTPSPFWHFRPVFGTWLWCLSAIGATSPSAWALAGVMSQLFAGLLVFVVLRARFDVSISTLGAIVVLVHPARRESLFWASAQIDLLCFGLSMSVLAMSRCSSRRRWTPYAIAVVAALAFWTKETAIALPLVLWFAAPPNTRWRMSLASGFGIAAAASISTAVLHGLGRSGSTRLQLSSVLTYVPRLVVPSDYGYRELISDMSTGQPVAALVVSGTLLASVGALWLAWSTRRERGWSLALIMIGVGAALFSIDAGDRSIWFGVVGVVWLLCLAAPRLELRASALVVLVLLSWPLLWCDAWRRFSLAQHSSSDIERAAAELPSGRLLLVLGLPERIARAAWIAPPAFDHACMESVAPLTGLAAVTPRSSLNPSDGMLRVHPIGEGVRASCQLAGPAATCSAHDVRVDAREALKFFADGVARCGPAAWFHWDGRRFVRLEP